MDENDDGAQSRMRASLNRLIAHGGTKYVRERHLPRLIAVHPDALAKPDAAICRDFVQRLNRALRGERNKARTGTWNYSLNRHIALMQAYKAELEMLGKAVAARRLETDCPAVKPGSRPSDFPRLQQNLAPATRE